MNQPVDVSLVRNLPVQALSTQESASLVLMREEEKLARDVYTFLARKWNVPVFTNIAASEQMHMDQLALLLTHGILHLLGYDHAEPDDEKEMFGLQKELLASFAKAKQK